MAMHSDAAEIESGPVPVESPPRRRLETVDILRGLLMMLMALDHIRDFSWKYGQLNPTDPLHSTLPIFFTRWATHLCAPGFVALAGASVYIQRARGKSVGRMARFLLSRGLWLIFMEATVVDFGFSFHHSLPAMQVIYAVGLAMIFLAPLQYLKPATVGLVGVLLIAGHNLLDKYQPQPYGAGDDLWRIFEVPGVVLWHAHALFFVFYPVLAWIGIICVGYWFGTLANAAITHRQRLRRSALLGVAFLAVFAVLRALHLYGDTFSFSAQGGFAEEVMSFLQVQKYPPSLDYCLATFGVLLLLYALFEAVVAANVWARARGVAEVFGRVPFFYYILHIYLYHAMAILAVLAIGGRVVVPVDGFPYATKGFGLPGVYGLWLLGLVILYFPCRWFAGVKARRRDWWLSYL